MGKTTFAAELVHNFSDGMKGSLLGTVLLEYNELSSHDREVGSSYQARIRSSSGAMFTRR